MYKMLFSFKGKYVLLNLLIMQSYTKKRIFNIIITKKPKRDAGRRTDPV